MLFPLLASKGLLKPQFRTPSLTTLLDWGSLQPSRRPPGPTRGSSEWGWANVRGLLGTIHSKCFSSYRRQISSLIFMVGSFCLIVIFLLLFCFTLWYVKYVLPKTLAPIFYVLVSYTLLIFWTTVAFSIHSFELLSRTHCIVVQCAGTARDGVIWQKWKSLQRLFSVSQEFKQRKDTRTGEREAKHADNKINAFVSEITHDCARCVSSTLSCFLAWHLNSRETWRAKTWCRSSDGAMSTAQTWDQIDNIFLVFNASHADLKPSADTVGQKEVLVLAIAEVFVSSNSLPSQSCHGSMCWTDFLIKVFFWNWCCCGLKRARCVDNIGESQCRK